MTATKLAEDTLAMAYLHALPGSYLPWNAASIRASHLVAILNMLLIQRRQRVLECGSGIATVYLARLFRQRGGGQVVSIEHDAAWADVVRDLLAQEMLQPYAKVIQTPLTGSGEGYDAEVLHDLLAAEAHFDALLVTTSAADEAVFPFMRAHLTEEALILLDEAEGKQAVLAQWQQDGARLAAYPVPGLALLKKQEG
ncbi:MAG: class I SAM-dependent methyltransferase [Anaerolineae bacterium]|nr:class I SAM-dependent methyltransferase [Anaerolineae bacterium]